MNLFTRIRLVALLAKTRLTWHRRNTHYAYRLEGHPKFMGSRDAVKLIPDGAVIATSGLAGNQRPSILYWAIRELFEETGHPCSLTVICTGGQGGRGKVPGTVEEFGAPGLCTRLISGHLETYKSLLSLGVENKIELQCIPQGEIALLFDAQGRGEDSFLTRVGVNTFLDPRVGRGTPLTGVNAEQLVSVEGDQLRYRLPRIDVAMFNAYAADRDGNIYVTHCPMKAEMLEIARAAKRNGGTVIANVSRVVDKGFDEIYVPAELVDAVVVYPRTEQGGFVRYHRHLAHLTMHGTLTLEEGIARARFVNQVMGITPRRTPIDDVIARLAAQVFVENVPRGALVNVGVGLPENVCAVLQKAGVLRDVTLFTESGVIGGVPAPGFFFGAAIRPEKIVSSAEMFRTCWNHLDTAILGVLQADSEGNVNVSKRGDNLARYVGPGGFLDLTMAAKTIIFVTKWMEGAIQRVEGGRVRLVKTGHPKFVDRVDEITFSGQEALRAGKNVFYATGVGLFQLTARGMELVRVFPGIDIQKDILQGSSTRIVLPESGSVPEVDASVVTGRNFTLSLAPKRA